jgi:prepilin-type N-terminal cleavage/methylation domain-containing protein
MTYAKRIAVAVEAAVPAANARHAHAIRLPLQSSRVSGFTLVELLVSMVVLLIIVFVVAQMVTSATAVTRNGHKHISTDTQARTVLDRMALDFAQMMKRTDIDYYVKGITRYQHGNGHGWGHYGQTNQPLNDQIAFFTHVPGYYASSSSQSPISIVAYRVNQNANASNAAYLKLERLGRGLPWNGTNPGGGINPNYPMAFLPITIGSLFPAAINNNSNCGGSGNSSCDPFYETIGPGVFRMEYYYVLKNGQAVDYPWNRDAGHNSIDGIGLGDVEGIAVVIAVIDSAGRALINAANSSSLYDIGSDLADFASAHGRGTGQQNKYIGQVENDWKGTLFGDSNYPGIINTGYTSNNTPVPKEAVKGIRVYSRTFDLKTLPTF